ncbi:MAG: hypothetical protein FJW66_03910 [Actinobacteria bacterium]|nr:hypothetical protein [Actinomycetota bacterium]
MRYEFKPSFDKTFKKLPSVRKLKVEEALTSLIDFFETGKKTKGLGLKNLRKEFWEIRSGINDRVIFTLSQGKVSFIITGTHDEIKRFLKAI